MSSDGNLIGITVKNEIVKVRRNLGVSKMC